MINNTPQYQNNFQMTFRTFRKAVNNTGSSFYIFSCCKIYTNIYLFTYWAIYAVCFSNLKLYTISTQIHNYVIVLLGRLCDIHGTQRLVKSHILPCKNWYNFSLVLQDFFAGFAGLTLLLHFVNTSDLGRVI